MSTPVVAALLAELDERALHELAQRLAPHLPDVAAGGSADSAWLDSRRAAEHLGLSRHALHKLTAARAIPFEQEDTGCRLWFQREQLNEWVRAGRPATTRLRRS
ncbi:MAG: hypothetical protein ACYCUM_09215 [Solirubrobacteraceae bacterium]